MNIQKNVLLKKFTTFHIGGLADFFVHVRSIDELKEALLYAQKNLLEVFILGGGSNIVFSDDGFRGLVIKIEIKGVICRDVKKNDISLEIGGGEVWDEFVSYCVSQGFYGVENLSAIPGTVGAAPIQNIGAYGVEVKDVIEWVDVISIKTGEVKRFLKDECAFEYRNSFFKTKKGKTYVVVRVCFNLKKNNSPNLSYKDLANYFKEENGPSLKSVRKAVIAIRSKKFPNLDKVGTAGSFFKNPIITHREYKALEKKYPGIPSYYSDRSHVKIPLGFILEKLGWKGKKYKQVGTYKKQALVIVNNRSATQEQLKEFVRMIEKDIKEKTGITIEREVNFVM